jgi:hypothetical protein
MIDVLAHVARGVLREIHQLMYFILVLGVRFTTFAPKTFCAGFGYHLTNVTHQNYFTILIYNDQCKT